MSVPFNANEFRQQMSGQNAGVPQASQQITQAVSQAIPPQQMVQPGQPQAYVASQQPAQLASPPMAPQPVHQQTTQGHAPMLQQQPQMQPQPHFQNSAAQVAPYQPSQPQMPQQQAQQYMSAQQQQFMPPVSAVVNEVEKPVKSIFGIRLGRKLKAPESTKVAVQTDKVTSSIITKSSLLPFVAGIALGAIGMMFLGNMVADKTDQKFAAVQAAMAEAEASAVADLSMTPEPTAIETEPQSIETVRQP